jgi:hypothetical protein
MSHTLPLIRGQAHTTADFFKRTFARLHHHGRLDLEVVTWALEYPILAEPPNRHLRNKSFEKDLPYRVSEDQHTRPVYHCWCFIEQNLQFPWSDVVPKVPEHAWNRHNRLDTRSCSSGADFHFELWRLGIVRRIA